MVEAIDALARRVEYMSRSFKSTRGAPKGSAGEDSPALMTRLLNIEAKLAEIAAHGPTPPPVVADTSGDADTIKHILQLQDRLMVELKAFGRKLDTASVRVPSPSPLLSPPLGF